MSWSLRLQNSWQLFAASLRVLTTHPRLWLFPIITAVCTLIIAGFFLSPIFVIIARIGFNDELMRQLNTLDRAVMWTYMAGLYVASMFVATFFNVAFYHQIMRALSGQPVSLADGFRFAVSRLGAILCWSLLAATVGMIIRAIEDRLGWVGKLVMGLIGVVWSVAAVFAVPVIIRREDNNPLTVLRDSAATLKRAWGESLIGFVGIRVGSALVVIASIAVTLTSVALGALTGKLIIPAISIGIWLLAFIVFGLAVSVATHVYRCALYVFATEGVIPEPYTADMMNAAWKVKKR